MLCPASHPRVFLDGPASGGKGMSKNERVRNNRADGRHLVHSVLGPSANIVVARETAFQGGPHPASDRPNTPDLIKLHLALLLH